MKKLLLAALVLCGVWARGATITVTTLNDEDSVNAAVSLREAIRAALSDVAVDGSTAGSGADTIIFSGALVAAGDVKISVTNYSVGTNTFEMGPSAWRITNTITIIGPSNDFGVTLERAGANNFRFFHVASNGNLTLKNLTLRKGVAKGGNGGEGNGGGGGAAGLGGAIFNDGVLSVLQCTLSENEAVGGYGYIGAGNNGGGGGGGVATVGSAGSNPSGGAGGKPNGGAANTSASGQGGGGGGGNHPSGSTGQQIGPNAGAGGFGGGGGGGGYTFTTGTNAVAGDGGNGGFGGGGGGGGTCIALNGPESPGTAGTSAFGGGGGDPGIAAENQAGGDGGGGAGLGGAIFNRGGTVSVVNSTVSGNKALGGASGDPDNTGYGTAGGGGGYGGGVFSRNGVVTMTNVTVAANVVTPGTGTPVGLTGGGGIYYLGDAAAARLVLRNTLVGNCTGATYHVHGALINAGSVNSLGSGNLIETFIGFTGTVVSLSDPILAGLADNRGPTKTHALLTGSPAIDAGDGSFLGGTTDQRGGIFNRVADGNLDTTSVVDIGAYERVFIDYGDAPDTAVGTGRTNALLQAGLSEFRVSIMGNDAVAIPGNRTQMYAQKPQSVYNQTNDEFMVVWYGTDDTPPVTTNEFEVYGQRLNAKTGAKIGSQFRISAMGIDSDTNPVNRINYYAVDPSIAFNRHSNQYLVVWAGDDNTNGLVDNEVEIWGQIISATGVKVGSRFRISSMGPNGNTSYYASNPDVVFNGQTREYVVVWRADDNTPPLVDDELEIYAQRIGPTGALLGARTRISVQGNDAEANMANRQLIFAADPKIAFDSLNNRYVVVWYGDSDVAPMTNNEVEVWARVLNTNLSFATAPIRVSTNGPNGSDLYYSSSPDVAVNSINGDFLVTWHGDHHLGGQVDDEYEIFAKLFNAGGTQLASQLRISDMGPNGVGSFAAINSTVVHTRPQNAYLVAWYGDDEFDNKQNIYGQRLSAGGSEIGSDTLLFSSGAGTEDLAYNVFSPNVSADAFTGRILLTFQGDNTVSPTVDNETEIYGLRFLDAPINNYNTTATDNGPSHVGVNGLRLGALLDSEADGIPSVGADGDDDTESDDEDGVVNPSQSLTLIAGVALSVTVTVQNVSGSAATLYGWIDYNSDGIFDNGTERASAAVPNGTTGNLVLTFPVVPASATNATFARFRISSDGAAANATGAASSGEVEDYPALLLDSDGDGLADSWEVDNFGDVTITDGSGDFDGDGFPDLHEYIAGTMPTNNQSLLRIDSLTFLTTNRHVVSWPSIAGRTYHLVYKTDLLSPVLFTNIVNIPATFPLNTATSTVNQAPAHFFIRVK